MVDKSLFEVHRKDILTTLYTSYSSRLQGVRREMHASTVLLVGLYGYGLKVLIESQPGYSDPNLFSLLLFFSLILHLYRLNFATYVVRFSRLLQRVEQAMDLPGELSYFRENLKARQGNFYLIIIAPTLFLLILISLYLWRLSLQWRELALWVAILQLAFLLAHVALFVRFLLRSSKTLGTTVVEIPPAG